MTICAWTSEPNEAASDSSAMKPWVRNMFLKGAVSEGTHGQQPVEPLLTQLFYTLVDHHDGGARLVDPRGTGVAASYKTELHMSLSGARS